MAWIYGHDSVVASLEAYLPSVTLLLGPEHVGKKTIAKYIMDRYAWPLDRMWISRPTVSQVQEVAKFATYAPFGPCRVVVLCLDAATPSARNALLKLLEEPPATVRFILVSAWLPPATIKSRAQTFACGFLQDAAVEAVLQSCGVDADTAKVQAPRGAGQVRPALEAVGRTRSMVLSALRAASSGDSLTLSAALRNWDVACQRMLVVWCQEATSGRWRLFEASDCSVGCTFAWRVLASLAALGKARPKLSARTALDAAGGAQVLYRGRVQ